MSSALITLLVAGVAYIFYLVVVPEQILTVHPNEHGNAYTVADKEVGRGEAVLVSIDYCKTSNPPLIVRAWLEIADARYEITTGWAPLPVGCHSERLSLVPVPSTLAIETVGKAARLVVRKVYYPGSFRQRGYDLTSDTFRITQ